MTMENYIETIAGPIFPGLISPSTSCVSGVSGSGKTTLVHKILKFKNVLYTTPVSKVLYCMSVDQPLYQEMKRDITGLTFHEGIPSEEDLNAFTDGTKHSVVVLDDLMEQVVRSVDAQNLFTKWSHHKCISVIYITQNIYAQGKCARNVSMNTHYFFVMCNPRDVRQISVLANQTGLGETLTNSYKDCVLRKKYGYQVVSLHPAIRSIATDSPRLKACIHTNIFPGEHLISYL